MAGRYRSENETAPTRALKNNCWLRLNGRKWFTPDEFKLQFGESAPVENSKIEILNPIPFWISGRQVVYKMILDKKPTSTILSALERLYAFEDKIMATGFKVQPNQLDRVVWPDPREKAVPIFERVKRPPPSDYNDLIHEGKGIN